MVHDNQPEVIGQVMNQSQSEHSAYVHVQAYLEALRLSVSASFLFGFLVAKILRGEMDAQKNLSTFASVVQLKETQLEKLSSVVTPLTELLHKNLVGDWFAMAPLLPSEELPLSARIFSLREFLQAFLNGIGEDISQCCDLNEEVNEIFEDFAILAQMDMDTEDSQESEKDFMEIVEYIKISIMLLTEHAHYFVQQKKAKENQIHH